MSEADSGKKYDVAYDGEHGVVCLKTFAPLDGDDVRELMSIMGSEFKGKEYRRILCDLSEGTANMVTREARKAFKDTAGIVEYDKIAMFGASPPMRMAAKVILAITGSSRVTKFFKTKEDALAWLREKER